MDAEVAALLSLKAQYTALTGRDLAGGHGKKKSSKTPTQPPREKKKGPPQAVKKEGVADVQSGPKKQTR